MKRLIAISLAMVLAGSASAQTDGSFPTIQRQDVGVSVSTVYQRYDDDGQLLEQLSLPVTVSIPLGTNFGMSLRAAGATASGSDSVEPVSGLADAQIGAHYVQPIGKGSLIASLGANLPSGRRELTPDEHATSVLISQKFFGFHLPVLGQGLAVSPGVTAAWPLGESLALGAGISYQYKAAYRPLETLESDYDPGNEVLLTLGLDVRVGQVSALSGDVTYTRYGADEMDEETTYEAGDKVSATLQYLGYQGYNELRVVARYSTRSRGELPAADGILVREAERALPNLGRLLVTYRIRTGDDLRIGLVLQGRAYGTTQLFSSKRLIDAGVTPELHITDAVALSTRFIYTFGSFSGLEAAAGITARL